MTKPDRPNASSVSRYQDYRLEPKENVPAPPPPRTALGRRLRKAQQGTEQSDRPEDRHARQLSRRHAVVTGNDGRYTVADLGNRTGVFLNDEPVSLHPSPPLQPGDRLR